jgi:DNA repair exonuclease SbcCD ATPase subunit
MNVLSVEISNIFSIEQVNLSFDKNGLVLVEGYDHDTGRANGAGKSAIFNAMCFALYDKVPKKISKSEILRKDAKKGYCIVSVATSTGVYTVKRGKPNAVSFTKDGVDVDMTQQEFEDKLNINYEQFLLTMYNSQDSTERFINLNDTDKKTFLLKILNLNKFGDAKANVSIECKNLEQEKTILITKIDGYRSNMAIYKNSIVDVSDVLPKIEQNNKDITTYTSKIKQLELVKEPDMSKYSDAENKLQHKLMYMAELKAKRSSELNRYNQYAAALKPFDPRKPDTICPACNVELNIEGKTLAKASDIEALEKQWKMHGEEAKIHMSEISSTINEIDKSLFKEQEIKDLIDKIKIKKQEEYRDYRDAQSSISEYSNCIRLKNMENYSLETQINNSNDIKNKVKDIVAIVNTAKQRLKHIEDELSILKAVEAIFDSTGAPAYVIDCIVDAFNSSVEENIADIWPNATYSIKTYKENKDKTIKAKISESLTMNGKEVSIGSLSGGENKAFSLALDFAIIGVIGSQYGLDLNPIILDEPFDGLDAIGREIVIDLLSKLSEKRQILVIDHASEAKSMFSNVVRVEKHNGVSKIIK